MNASNDFDRLIVRALRSQRLEALPQDLLASTLARVEAIPESADRLEKWLQRGLFAALFGAAVVALVLVGGERLAREVTTGHAASWILVVLVCLMVSQQAHRCTAVR